MDDIGVDVDVGSGNVTHVYEELGELDLIGGLPIAANWSQPLCPGSPPLAPVVGYQVQVRGMHALQSYCVGSH